MPSIRQLTMMDTVPTTKGGKGHSDTAKLKSAYGDHPDSIVKPDKTSWDIPTGVGAATVKIENLERANIREAYELYVKSGLKTIPGWGWAVSLSYNSDDGLDPLAMPVPPTLGTVTPEGEASHPTGIGSTIVASGLGPNVNIHPIGSIEERIVIDASMPGSTVVLDPYHTADGSRSPSETSTKIAEETSLPPGDLGDATSGGY